MGPASPVGLNDLRLCDGRRVAATHSRQSTTTNQRADNPQRSALYPTDETARGRASQTFQPDPRKARNNSNRTSAGSRHERPSRARPKGATEMTETNQQREDTLLDQPRPALGRGRTPISSAQLMARRDAAPRGGRSGKRSRQNQGKPAPKAQVSHASAGPSNLS